MHKHIQMASIIITLICDSNAKSSNSHNQIYLDYYSHER